MCRAKESVWVKIKDLLINKPYRITDYSSKVSKFDSTKTTLKVQLENENWVTLPSRFGGLPEEDIDFLKSKKAFLINKGPKGQTYNF